MTNGKSVLWWLLMRSGLLHAAAVMSSRAILSMCVAFSFSLCPRAALAIQNMTTVPFVAPSSTQTSFNLLSLSDFPSSFWLTALPTYRVVQLPPRVLELLQIPMM